MPDPRTTRIAIVGATGAVGLEALAILAERGIEPQRVGAFASARSAGTRVPFGPAELTVEAITPQTWDRFDLAILCTDAATARRLAPTALHAGVTVIDNSSAFRLDSRIPLVIPEVNGRLLDDRPPLVASPNCSTTILLTTLEPIRRTIGIDRLAVSTYQAVSGAGLGAIEELRAQTRAAAEGRDLPPRLFPHPCALNVFPHESSCDEHGHNEEERKIIAESRRIWNADLPIAPTCIRVPVLRAHSQSIAADLASPTSRRDIEDLLREAPGLRLMTAADGDPTPLRATGRDEILVGRVRIDPGDDRRLLLWLSADQLRKGAALNAIQVADRLFAAAAPARRPAPMAAH